MIPYLREWSDNKISSNGICRLTDCIEATVTEIRNGEYTCQFVYPIGGTGYDQIQLGRLISCTHDASGDLQPFTIYRREANLDGTETFYAQHLSYELNYVVQKPFTANGAAGMFEYLDTHRTSADRTGGRYWDTVPPSSPYRFSTDVVSAAVYTLNQPTPLRTMMGGMQASVLDIYGGELEWDRYNVILHADRGKDGGAVIRYGGNLTGAQDSKDTSAAYGTVVPFWVDKSTGVVTNYSAYSKGNTDEYFPWKALPLDLSQSFETQPTAAQAQEAAEAFLDAHQAWLPFNNLSVNFEPWTDAQIAAESERLQNVCLCDYVRVDILWMGVSLKSKVTKTVWNVLTDRYDSIELGDLNPSYGSVITAGSSNSGVTASGVAAHGLPAGGTEGQVLAKSSDTDYEAEWTDSLPALQVDDLDATAAALGSLAVTNGASVGGNLTVGGTASITGNTFFGGNVAVGADKLLKVVNVTVLSGQSIAANNYRDGSVSASTLQTAIGTGWTPLGLVGVHAGGTNNVGCTAVQYYISSSGGIFMRVRNFSSSASTLTMSVDVLCIHTSL